MFLQVVKAIWVYIKEHNLQDPKNKRKIIPDEKLGKVLPRTNMMMMNKHLSKHVYTAGEAPSCAQAGNIRLYIMNSRAKILCHLYMECDK